MALIDQIYVMGTPMSDELRGSITRCTLSGSMDAVTQLDMEFIDPNWRLLGSRVLTTGQRVEVGGYKLEVSNVSTGDNGGCETFLVKCRPIAFRRLKERQGPRVMNGVSPSEFVIAECRAVGVDYVVQPSARRAQVSRDVLENGQKPDVMNPPSSWTTFQRLAGELGFILFENQNVIYFGQPSWFLSSGRLAAVRIGYKPTTTGVLEAHITPSCARSLDDPQITMATSVIVNSVDEVRPGKVVELTGVPTFEGAYLIKSISAELLDTPNVVGVDAATPKDPEPRPATNSSSGGGPRITGPWYDESQI